MNTTEILSKVLKILNLDATHLALEIGASPSRITDIMTGRTKSITPKTADLIIKRFPNINKSFLLTGAGTPYADGAHIEPFIDEPALTPSQVLHTILQYYGIKPNTLSLSTGISRGTLSNLLSGNARPYHISKQNAQRILTAFPDLRLQWLMTGKNPMFQNGQNAPTNISGTNAITDADSITTISEADVPMPNVDAPAVTPAVNPAPNTSTSQNDKQEPALTRSEIEHIIECKLDQYFATHSGIAAEDLPTYNKKP